MVFCGGRAGFFQLTIHLHRDNLFFFLSFLPVSFSYFLSSLMRPSPSCMKPILLYFAD